MIERLFEAGVDVFRINMSHSPFDLREEGARGGAHGGGQIRPPDRNPV